MVGARLKTLLAATVVGLTCLVPATAATAAPANDDFADATAIGSAPATVGGFLSTATKETGEPNHAGNPGGHSVWFEWTAPEDTVVGIELTDCSQNLDALLAVYTGADVGSLTPVAGNRSERLGCGGMEVQFAATTGTTYRIAVDGANSSTGSFDLELSLPASNDDFADAEILPAGLPLQVFRTTKLAGKEPDEPDHAGDPGGHSVWFSWTPASDEMVEVETCGKWDTALAVYTGPALGALTYVASNDDGALPRCNEGNSEVRFFAEAGTTYRIAVDGASGAAGQFALFLQGRPAVDDFADAQTILEAPWDENKVAATLATAETGEPPHAGASAARSVWYSWTPSRDVQALLSLCPRGSSDVEVAVYTGSDVDALTPVATGEEAEGPCGASGREARFGAVAGTTYRIAVDAKGSAAVRFDVDLAISPKEDDFVKARNFGDNLPWFGFATTALATKETGEPDHAGKPGGHSVWIKWTAPTDRRVNFWACPEGESGGRAILAVYTGESLASLTPVGSAVASGPDCADAAEVAFDATAGTTYRVALDSEAAARFEVGVGAHPVNDDFEMSEDLFHSIQSGFDSNRFATAEAGEPTHAGVPGGHSVWYRWTPTVSGPVAITACGYDSRDYDGGIDTLLAVYTGSSVGGLTPVAADDDAPGDSIDRTFCPAGRSEVRFDAVAGTTYRIAIDGKGGDQGQFMFRFTRAPENDSFEDADLLGRGAIGTVGSTLFATQQAGEPQHAGVRGGHSVWYSWTPSTSGQVEFSTCTEIRGVDTTLAVYTGAGVGSLTPVAADDDAAAPSCRGGDSALRFQATADTTYRIAVGSKGDQAGPFQLRLGGLEPNDALKRAQAIPTEPTEAILGSNRFATKEVGEPAHAGNAGGHSVWFKWAAPRSGTVSVDTCDSSFDTLLAVYTGADVGALTPVAADDDGCSPQSRLTFEAVADTVYKIAVDGKGGAEGEIELDLEQAPRNDDLANAKWIEGSSRLSVAGTNRIATEQSGEPQHGGAPGGHSVWYSWTAFGDGTVALSACAEHFDPLLGVYTGSEVWGLAPVASEENGAGGCEDGVGVAFEAAAGTTYRIAVDGREDGSGHFQLLFQPAHRLTAEFAGAGAGTISSDLGSLSCTSLCTRALPLRRLAVLTATPAPGSSFAGWSGAGCSGTGPCLLTLDADTEVTAVFEPLPAGGGSGGDGGGGPTVNAPSSPLPPKPPRCRRGFKKKVVDGKPRCVKKKKKKRKHRRHR